ncbi:hypothetical protein FDP41_000014 [Naegleria fowleri]|uniref:Calponin-homology (CH) domain-containing protein n=1 Tax=Naegleria fowleri TaxID=5763 RepID=A0A6A5CI37_NAEFO|nr:uncharacterized protein FDP41_000014 [Naegleria fowleri]KAF0984975.1 hypothetical protein FDP41_000014 [Naegleria fowleri]CAG4718376.1 unnamed protein product [Naegleria fowleri]
MSTKLHTRENTTSVSGVSGVHSFDRDEVESFAEYISNQLKDDADVQSKMPIVGDELFNAVKDGIILCKLINIAAPHTIDERVINVKGQLNPWQINENCELAINSAAGIGCKTVNITRSSIQEGKPHIVLGLLWQVIKKSVTKDITIKHHPELVLLLKEGEDMESFVNLPIEEILMRWVNYHLAKSPLSGTRKITNFSTDIADSEIYTHLLNQIAPDVCDLSPLQEDDLLKRANFMLDQAEKIDGRQFIKAGDVVKGNTKLNLAFIANLFNTRPALEVPQDMNVDYASLLDFSSEGTREERSFEFWMQSLGLNVNHLFDDMRDGVVFAELCEKIKPGATDPKRYTANPKNPFQSIANCNYALDVSKSLGVHAVGISGKDFFDKNKKFVLAVVWQLMKVSLLNTLKNVGGGKQVSEEDVLNWANKKVAAQKITSFEDPSLSDGKFLVHLCHAVSPQSCNLEMLSEESEQNAKYAISVARKIGAVVFLLWEDIVEVNKKMILSFVASLMLAEMHLKK